MIFSVQSNTCIFSDANRSMVKVEQYGFLFSCWTSSHIRGLLLFMIKTTAQKAVHYTFSPLPWFWWG